MLTFHKFHGLGNDFILVDGEEVQPSLDQVRALCDRNRGVGADGVLVVTLLSPDPLPAVQMVIFNQDGSRPEMCGNGVRCVAAYAQTIWGVGDELVVHSDAGPRRCEIQRRFEDTWQVAVDMGEIHVQKSPATLEVGKHSFSYHFVDAGNPHAVIFERPDIETIDEAGRQANDDHPLFADGVNLEFAEACDGGFEVVVYERGVGRTRACGTGACAVAAAAWHTKRASPEQPVSIHLPGGPLIIERREQSVWMTGEAQSVFDGQWRDR